MEKKICRNMCQKLVPGPISVLVNSLKQPMHVTNSIENTIFWKRIIIKLQKFEDIEFLRWDKKHFSWFLKWVFGKILKKSRTQALNKFT